MRFPYNAISLIDISHNRNFCKKDLYAAEDVLWNISENRTFEKYSDKSVVELQVKLKVGQTTIQKSCQSFRNPVYHVLITLKHSPLECMYPHSVFEIKLNESVVTWGNWGDGLGSKKGGLKKVAKELRGDLRQILTSMIISGQVDNSDIQQID